MDRLNGWKTIAAYLRRDERTARRWAAESGMPVYRMPGPGRGSVYAIAEEIDAWIEADRALSCPRLSGPSTMIVWTTKGTTNAEQEAQAGRDHREAT